ncbi:hypothetical protein RZS08_19710, partial [Arthrospira platensis SPKY1]|nr:hypothetical protein [Arthrospira platensis SPKY1]
TQAAEVLCPDHIPEPEANIETAIGQPGDAADHQRIRTPVPPQRHVRPGVLIQHTGSGVDETEHTAALQIGSHDGRDVFAGAVVAPETDNGERQAGGTGAGNLHPKLGMRLEGKCRRHRKHQPCPQQMPASRQETSVGSSRIRHGVGGC